MCTMHKIYFISQNGYPCIYNNNHYFNIEYISKYIFVKDIVLPLPIIWVIVILVVHEELQILVYMYHIIRYTTQTI